MKIQHFFDTDTATLTYIVFDEKTQDAVVIDPVWDYDPASGKTDTHSLELLFQFIELNKLHLHAVLETHAHADHITGAHKIKQRYPSVQVGIGERIKIVQDVFEKYFNLTHLKKDDSVFDIYFQDFEEISFGTLQMKAIPTPGHTPACMSYLFNNEAVFTGDALFMPDSGTGRCDFPNGSAKDLYHSIMHNLYTLPDETPVYVGHDYAPNGREMKFTTTIGESKQYNIQLKKETTQNDYIIFREKRDQTLKAPRLLLPSIQVNINAGILPPKENNQVRYLKLPISE
mgnify:FL=1